MNKHTTLIVDGTNLVHRMYYVHNRLSNNKGIHTGAIYGFFKMLLYYAERLDSNRFVICWEDPTGENWRKQLLPEYKHNRVVVGDKNIKLTKEQKEKLKKKQQIHDSILRIGEICKQAGLVQLYKKGFEADDCIGYVVKKLRTNIKIISKDKDMMQFVNDKRKVRVVYPDDKMSYLIVNEKKVEEMFGVGADKIVDLLSLTGDDVDNISGLNKVGRKTAVKMIEKANGKYNKVLDKKQMQIFERNKVLIDLVNTPLQLSMADIKFFYVMKVMQLKEMKRILNELQIKSIKPYQLLQLNNKDFKKQILIKVFQYEEDKLK